MNFGKIFITGGAGFVGSHLSKALVGSSEKLTIYDDLSMGRTENIPEGAEFVEADILDFARLKDSISDAEVIFHLAAKVSVRASMDNFYGDAQTNLVGTLNLLRAIRGSSVRKIVFASSMAVYADSKIPKPLSEDYSTDPISFYGISKLASEKYILMAAKQLEIEAVILRYFNIFGPGQAHTPYVGVMTIFVNNLLSGKPPVIFGTGEQKRDFVSVHDVTRANIAAMSQGVHSRVLNIGTGKAISVNQIAELLIQKINPGIEPVHDSEREGELQNSIADIARARTILGFYPKVKIEDSVDEIVHSVTNPNK